jgi:pyranose oxidase
VPPAIDKRTIVDLRYFGKVEPQWSNRVIFAGDLTDGFGMPQPTFHVKLYKKDRNITHKMMTDMQEVAGKLGGYLPGSEPQFLAPGLAFTSAAQPGPQPNKLSCQLISRRQSPAVMKIRRYGESTISTLVA